MGELGSADFWLYFANKALRLGVICLIAMAACRFSGAIVERFFQAQASSKKFYLEEKRARTLSAVLKLILRYAVYFITVVMILQEFRIDTTSILAGAGIIGLAVGVGAQSLVKDIITGFFIILEDQYAVGDYIASGDMAGTVEEIDFRVTKLRDANGVLHILPNGSITRLSNYTRGHMQAVINIPVAYQADIGKVLLLLEEACRDIGKSQPEVLDGPKVIGIVDLRPGEVIVRVVAKTLPLEQQKVETAFRHKVKLLFETAKIPAPAVSWPGGQERLP
ncbi:MAG: mechanosensitive ion channel family protein [Negativicutes bacterium]|nr:mechanosensitive ion channel family protein [Negativicutes bacterium]